MSRLLASLQHEADDAARAEQAATRDRFVNTQPRLDGSGGQLFAELDALGLAVVSEALDAGTPSPANDPDTTGERHFVGPRDAHDRWHLARARGARRADRLVGICARALAGGTAAAPRRWDPP